MVLLPAKLYMFLDLSNCKIESENEQNTITRQSQSSRLKLLHKSLRNVHETASEYLLSKKKFAVIHSCDDHGYIKSDDYPDKYHFESKLSKRFRMENEKYRLVPVERIMDQAFCISDDSLVDHSSIDAIGNIAINIEFPNQWADYLIE